MILMPFSGAEVCIQIVNKISGWNNQNLNTDGHLSFFIISMPIITLQDDQLERPQFFFGQNPQLFYRFCIKGLTYIYKGVRDSWLGHSNCTSSYSFVRLRFLPRICCFSVRSVPSPILGLIYLYLLLPALLATKWSIPSVHEDVTVMSQGPLAEKTRIKKMRLILVVAI